jgi:hypothetical protein
VDRLAQLGHPGDDSRHLVDVRRPEQIHRVEHGLGDDVLRVLVVHVEPLGETVDDGMTLQLGPDADLARMTTDPEVHGVPPSIARPKTSPTSPIPASPVTVT